MQLQRSLLQVNEIKIALDHLSQAPAGEQGLLPSQQRQGVSDRINGKQVGATS
jgi:hypothetical protein